MDRYIKAPLCEEDAKSLRAGDYVYITGTIYTARDAAHKRMQEALNEGRDLPFDIRGNIIYYMGPSPAREGDPSALPDRRQPAGWISMRRNFLIWGFAA